MNADAFLADLEAKPAALRELAAANWWVYAPKN